MKKSKSLLLTALTAMGCVGLVAFSSLNTALVVTKADTAEKDLSGITDWKSSEGNFPSIDNWYSSKAGISFEFKLKTKGVCNAMVVRFYDSERDVSSNVRLWDKSSGLPVISSGYLGQLQQLSTDSDWYLYELIFTELAKESSETVNKLAANTESIKNATVIGMKAAWGASYFNNVIVKNMKIVYRYSSIVNFVIEGQTTKKFVNSYVDDSYTPKISGKCFEGWYLDKDLKNKFDISTLVTSGLTLYAKFVNHEFNEYHYDDNNHWLECHCGEKIETEAHTYEEVQDPKFVKNPATCTRPATYFKSCKCGKMSNETFSTGDIDPTNHIPGEAEIVNLEEPTCEKDGGYKKVIKCTECGKELETIGVYTITKTGHQYEATEWTLNENKTSGTVKFVCSLDRNHTVEKPVNVRKDTIDPTYEIEGKNIYTLSVEFEGKQYSHVITETIGKLVPEKKKEGCGSSIVTSSFIIGALSLLGIGLSLIKANKKD